VRTRALASCGHPRAHECAPYQDGVAGFAGDRAYDFGLSVLGASLHSAHAAPLRACR